MTLYLPIFLLGLIAGLRVVMPVAAVAPFRMRSTGSPPNGESRNNPLVSNLASIVAS